MSNKKSIVGIASYIDHSSTTVSSAILKAIDINEKEIMIIDQKINQQEERGIKITKPIINDYLYMATNYNSDKKKSGTNLTPKKKKRKKRK